MTTQKVSFDWVKKASTVLIEVLCFAFILFIFLQSVFCGIYMGPEQHTYFLKGSLPAALAAMAAFIGGAMFLRSGKGRFKLHAPGDRLLKILTVAQSVALVLLLLNLQIKPIADQYYVMECSANWVNGIASSWLPPEGYCFIFPYENGFALLNAFFAIFVGINNWLFVQLLNVGMIVVCAVYTAKITHLLFGDEALSRFTYLFCLLFFPLNCYVTFVYGTLIGLAACLAGLYHVAHYLQGGKPWRVAAGGLLLAFAYVIKGNYLIFILAAVLLLLCNAIYRHRAQFAVAAMALVGCMLVLNQAATTATCARMGLDKLSPMIPMEGYIAMGMQEGSMAPGWYNAYVCSIYEDNNYDLAETKRVACEELQARINKMIGDPSYALQFYSKKTASQWTEGTFQGVWLFQGRSYQNTPAGWLVTMTMEGSPQTRFVEAVCNLFLPILYLGALLFLWFERRRLDPNKLLFGILFLGGFFYLLIWEAKSQYTVAFVYLLLPYMLRGYQALFHRLDALRAEPITRQALAKNGGMRVLGITLAALLLVGVCSLNVVNHSLKVSVEGDDAAWAKTIREYSGELDDGRYEVTTAQDGKNLVELVGSERAAGSRRIYVNNNSLRVEDDLTVNLKLDTKDHKKKIGTAADIGPSNDHSSQKWTFLKSGSGQYLLRSRTGLYLTYDSAAATLTLQEYTGAENQLWNVTRA